MRISRDFLPALEKLMLDSRGGRGFACSERVNERGHRGGRVAEARFAEARMSSS